ncbi:metal ABC transporter substrate-binding protein [Athalassotoga saccharophila]|uniref:metal ABC transporter substrate-binding protein n=1 Tax=Athalassotoga saccharophila TaxID=1441386 RepID=UPI001379E7B8|nr:metal ABC transporter substrate-binding protein [Athalassotoga saccharophila]BBJ28978.1 putative metal ABC transporter substrate-binding protein Hpf [Athalassotoga saccharophila]
MRIKLLATLMALFAIVGILVFGKLTVVTTIPPLGYMVSTIGGSAVDVSVLEKPGDNPHNFNLTPQQALFISKSEVFVDLGLEEDAWIGDRVRSINPSLKVIDATKDLSQFLIGEPGAYNPHVWLDVKLYEMMAINVYSALVKFDPADQAIFSNNFSKFILSLDQLNDRIVKDLEPIKGKPFIAQHPAWDYFARAYGLGTEYSLENDAGQSIGPKDYQAIIEAMKKYNIKSIIGDPVTSSKLANQLASQTGSKIVEINPIFNFNYFDLMNAIVKGFLEALK